MTRAEAKALGLTRYATGKSCKRGHIAERLVSDKTCIECDKERNRRRRRTPAWKKANAEKGRQYSRQWRARNPEKNLEQVREWKAKNPDRVRALNQIYKRTRRAKKIEAGGKFSLEDIAEILKQQNGRCAYCRCKLGKKFECDHIMPLVLGGSNDRRNIQAVCRSCNRRKRSMHPIQFAQQLGKLL
jgi:5-methylcytosine-specific restriction endonuclease McrA